MGVALREASEAADRLFCLADQVTGLPIGERCATGPLPELTRTHVAQVGVVTTSLAVAVVIAERTGSLEGLTAVAGHSVGEIAAMCVAGAFDPETAIRLVDQRGRLMERDSEACNGTMVAVLGLDAERLASICVDASAQSGSTVQVANLNAPGQVVLSGDRAAIAVASELATSAGARRVLSLNVGGPFHSVYMEQAATDYQASAASAPFTTPRVPVVLNTTAEPTSDVDMLRAELPSQITRPVRWEESIQRLSTMGCDTFVELGPGQVVTGMVKRIVPGATAIAAGTPDSIDQVVELLARARTA
jgi:[acyl-carrier-protein] S-malonyltransferase